MNVSKQEIKVYLSTIILWSAACISFNVWRIYSYINNANDLDIFAHTWSFGFIVFMVFYLPIWLFGLFIVLVIERSYLVNAEKQRKTP
jgi:hypothetical protein